MLSFSCIFDFTYSIVSEGSTPIDNIFPKSNNITIHEANCRAYRIRRKNLHRVRSPFNLCTWTLNHPFGVGRARYRRWNHYQCCSQGESFHPQVPFLPKINAVGQMGGTSCRQSSPLQSQSCQWIWQMRLSFRLKTTILQCVERNDKHAESDTEPLIHSPRGVFSLRLIEPPEKTSWRVEPVWMS